MKSAVIATTIVSLVSFAAALTPDPSGAANVGNGQGKQFITGGCVSDADCGSGCCAKPIGICSGPGAAFQQGKQGCGFGGGASAATSAAPAASSAAAGGAAASAAPATPAAASGAATAAPATASLGGPPFDPSGAANVGNGAGKQFIGGQCLSNADCGSGCCAGPSGICSGPGASTQAGKTGCGHVSKRFVSVRESLVDLD